MFRNSSKNAVSRALARGKNGPALEFGWASLNSEPRPRLEMSFFPACDVIHPIRLHGTGRSLSLTIIFVIIIVKESFVLACDVMCNSCSNCQTALKNISTKTVCLSQNISAQSNCISLNGDVDTVLNCSGWSLTSENIGILIDSSHRVVITNCSIISTGDMAIVVRDFSSEVEIVQNQLISGYYESIKFNTGSSATLSGNGVVEGHYEGITVLNSATVNITGNQLIYGRYEGITVSNSATAYITGNQLISGEYDGIDVSNSATAHITGNIRITAGDGGHQPILFRILASGSIVGNNMITCEGNDEGIMLKTNSNATIQGNNIENNGVGIYIDATSSADIEDNRIVNNDRGINILGAGSNIWNNYFDNTNNRNALCGSGNTFNLPSIVYDPIKPNILGGTHLGGNFWSDYAGVDTTGNGIGHDPHSICGGSVDQYPLTTVVELTEETLADTKGETVEDTVGETQESFVPIIPAPVVVAVATTISSLFLILIIISIVVVVVILVFIAVSGGTITVISAKKAIRAKEKLRSELKRVELSEIGSKSPKELGKANNFEAHAALVKFLRNLSVKKVFVKIIPYEELKLDNYVYSGVTGTIFKGTLLSSDKVIAYKSFVTEEQFGKEELEEFKREVEIFLISRNEFINTFHGIVFHENHVGVITDFASFGDLEYFITKNPVLYLKERVRLLSEIAFGLVHLHSNTVIHRDLKPQNVVINEELVAKLIDFGISRVCSGQSRKTTKIGTLKYMSPQMFNGAVDYTGKTDVYSMSIMVWETVCGNFTPYKNNSNDNLNDMIFKASNDPNIRPDIADFSRAISKMRKNFQKRFVDLLKSMWAQEEEDRPSSFKVSEELRAIYHCLDDPVIVYIKTPETSDEDAEDFLLPSKDVNSLFDIVYKRWGRNKRCSLYQNGVIIESDKNVKTLKDDDIIEVRFDDDNLGKEVEMQDTKKTPEDLK